MYYVDTVPSRAESRAVDYVVRDEFDTIIFRSSNEWEAEFTRLWAEYNRN